MRIYFEANSVESITFNFLKIVKLIKLNGFSVDGIELNSDS
jgi:hypothetical protein